MVGLAYVGFTGDGIMAVEVVGLMRRSRFDWLDVGSRSARGAVWSSS